VVGLGVDGPARELAVARARLAVVHVADYALACRADQFSAYND
jgi:hypothetical protein